MYDLFIKNIDIADGSGDNSFRGNVIVKDGKIVDVIKGTTYQIDAKKVINGTAEQLLAPGFIDTHTHGDLYHIDDPLVSSQILQGVTYDICGNCGISAAPIPSDWQLLKNYARPVLPFDKYDDEWKTWKTFGAYIESVKKRNPIFQGAALVGHGTLRLAAMGMANRAPTNSELNLMIEMLEEALSSGAIGLSSGLVYTPGVYSDENEMITLCKVVAKYDKIYATHMRSESRFVVESVKESIKVAEKTGCKLIISHLKVSGISNKLYADEILRLIEDARNRGVKVINDQYQSNKGSTTLFQTIPPQYQSQGTEKALEFLKDEITRTEIIKNMQTDSSWENLLLEIGADAITIVSNKKYEEFNGKTLAEISKAMNKNPQETICELLIKNDGNVLMALTLCEQETVDKIFKSPYTAIGSDGIGAGSGTKTHPRATGNFAHMFQNYVRERKLVSWEEAIRKCTSLPFDFIGIQNKGHIKKGYDADITILDRNKIGTDASFSNPNVVPKGIDYVFIKGREVVNFGKVIK